MSLVAALDYRDWRMPAFRRSAASTPLAPSTPRHLGTTTQVTEPAWEEPVVDQLFKLQFLVDGWNGPNSVAPPRDTLAMALAVMYAIGKPNTKPPTVSPVSDGSLQLVWYAGGIELEISVSSSGVTDIGLFDVENGVEEADLTLLDVRLHKAIGRLSTV